MSVLSIPSLLGDNNWFFSTFDTSGEILLNLLTELRALRTAEFV
jgi:hypothetical protein